MIVFFLLGLCMALNPITTHGRYFIDSVTDEPVCTSFTD